MRMYMIRLYRHSITLVFTGALVATLAQARSSRADSTDCLAQAGLDNPVGDTIWACLGDPVQEKLGTLVFGTKEYDDLKKIKDGLDVIRNGYNAVSAASEENWAEAIEGVFGIAGTYFPGLECVTTIANNTVFKAVTALGCLSQQLATANCGLADLRSCWTDEKMFCNASNSCGCYTDLPYVPGTSNQSLWADCGWGTKECETDNDCDTGQRCTNSQCVTPEGCDGNGGSYDACGVCDGDGTSCLGCDGVANSGLVDDACGVCGGDGTSCMGCDGVAWSGLVYDVCGVCGGDDSSCAGCDGIPWSGASYDACGVCGGDGSSCSSGGGDGGGIGGGGGDGSLCDEIYGDWTWDECYMDDGCWDTCVENPM